MDDSVAGPALPAGVFLVSDTSTRPSHPLGSIILPGNDRPAKELRSLVGSVLHGSATGDGQQQRRFVFLTRSGWELQEAMEHTVRVGALLWEDNSVRVRLKFSRTRLALVVHASQGEEQALGFIFVDGLKSPLSSLRGELATQHPDLEKRLRERGYVFMDNNCWPVSPSQEDVLMVLDVVQDHTIVVSPSVVSNTGPQNFMTHTAPLPLTGTSAGDHRLTDQTDFGGDFVRSISLAKPCEILISYVHKEATTAATELKAELEKLQFSVFLDVNCIELGADWQDSLNDAVSNCGVFVPLVTSDYGRTLWTNREIKLADILGKLIIPVNFLSQWPPPCLAIQFATTQFVAWSSSSSLVTDSQHEAVRVAARIAEMTTLGDLQPKTKRVATDDGEESVDGPFSAPFLSKMPSLKSYGSLLPKNTPSSLSKAVLQPREGRPLVLVIAHQLQESFTKEIVKVLEGNDYETWCSVFSKEAFKERVDEAGVVILVLSNEFICCSQCEQQAYYSEGRKRIIPVIRENFAMAPWMATLIGTSTFLDARSANFKTSLLKRIEVALNPVTAEEEMMRAQAEEIELTQLTTSLSRLLPKQHLIYISGGTKFFSTKGEEICKEFGRQLAKKEVVVVTGGFYGVGETVGRSFSQERKRLQHPTEGVLHVIARQDEQDKSTQTRQAPDGSFTAPPYGHTLVFGNSVRQREMLVPRVLEVCILVEGGPGAAFEAEQFSWNGHLVIPVPVTGGAASGMFDAPQSIFTRPLGVEEADWSSLKDDSLSPSQIAAAMVRIVEAVLPSLSS